MSASTSRRRRSTPAFVATRLRFRGEHAGRRGEFHLVGCKQTGSRRAVMEASGGYERRWAEILRRPGSRSSSSIRSGSAISPGRPDGSPRTTGSTPRTSPGSARRSRTAPPSRMTASARRSTGCFRADALKNMEDQIKQQDEHQPPHAVANALREIARVARAERCARSTPRSPPGSRPIRALPAAPRSSQRPRPRRIRRPPPRCPGCPNSGTSERGRRRAVGAAPYDDDSGDRKGVRSIRGGRHKLRKLLYMPHHRAYGSVPRRFDRARLGRAKGTGEDRAIRNRRCEGLVAPPGVRTYAIAQSANRLRPPLGTLLRRDGVTPRSGFAWFAIAAKNASSTDPRFSVCARTCGVRQEPK